MLLRCGTSEIYPRSLAPDRSHEAPSDDRGVILERHGQRLRCITKVNIPIGDTPVKGNPRNILLEVIHPCGRMSAWHTYNLQDIVASVAGTNGSRETRGRRRASARSAKARIGTGREKRISCPMPTPSKASINNSV
jgi:hypothetical protein